MKRNNVKRKPVDLKVRKKMLSDIKKQQSKIY